MNTDQSNFNQDQRIMSDLIDLLAGALAKAQGEFNVAAKNSKNPFFKSNYADYESVVEASRPALSKYGLSVDFGSDIHWETNTTYMYAMLNHSSGQWKKSRLPYNPAKSDIQSLSSYNTYLKRMLYCNLTGVVTGEGDDDGEAAVEYTRNTTYQPQPVFKKETPKELLSKETLDKIYAELDGYPKTATHYKKSLKDKGNIDGFENIPKEISYDFLRTIQTNKEIIEKN